MSFGSVRLVPGVNVERTPTLLEAGYASSQLIRFKDLLAQKYGGWTKFYPFSITGTPRELHAWQDLNGTSRLAVGTTQQLAIINSGSLSDVTPQTKTTNPAVNFTTTINTAIVEIVDTGISNVTTFDAVYFNTPVAVAGLILSGLYAITTITGTTSYKITAAANATSSVSNGGAVPSFATTSASATVTVTLAAHGRAVGDVVVFPIATTVGGVTISGSYSVVNVGSAASFDIFVNALATSTTSASMNGGSAQFLYYINLGPPALGSGYGLGGYGDGGYGTGTTSASQTGTAITATDWSIDNWGKIILACPANGGIYQYDPDGGFTNAALVSSAPVFNGGIFVSVSQQILMAWASTATEDIGVAQDRMLIRWSTDGDYTDFLATQSNQAGSFRIPIGSAIKGGMAVANQDLFWTDLDLWAANYQGPPFVFGFNKIGAGAGLISSHAALQLRGGVFWMGPSNFYSYTANGVAVVPCPVWDFVFQNLNTTYASNVRALPNTPFNEAGWAFPSTASSSGESDCYVKFNISEPGAPWDYGPVGAMPRSAWMDQSVLGTPLGAISSGIIYQHESGNDADGSPLQSSFTTGYYYIADGEDYAYVDQVYPDFKWGLFGGSQSAQVQLTFNLVNYPGDTPTTYGPYTVTQATQYISTRMRGRQMSITVSSADLGSFWRLGRVRFRWQRDGRR